MPGPAVISNAGSTGFTADLHVPGSAVWNLEAANGCGGPSAEDELGPGSVRELRKSATVGWLVGVPAPNSASLEVLDVQTVRVDPGRFCPPVLDALRQAPEQSAARPAVELEDAGWIGDQPVMRMALRTLAFAPDGALTRVTAARVRVQYGTLTGSGLAEAHEGSDGPFGALLRRVLVNGPVPADPSAGRSHKELLRRMPGTVDGFAAADDGGALKIGVNQDGPVSVTGADLSAAGWNLAEVDPAAVRLEYAASGRALQMVGTEDGRIDPADRLVFEGRAMTGEYTRENVYWLRQAGEAVDYGRRDGTPSAASDLATEFATTLRFEKDTAVYYSMGRREGDDRWMWGVQMAAPAERIETLTVTNLAPGPHTARVRVALQGYTDDRATNPDHHVRLYLNGIRLADSSFDGLGVHVVDAFVPAGLLVEGSNSMLLEMVGDTSAVVDSLLLNWVELDVAAGYRATDDRLAFACPANRRYGFRLAGFTDEGVEVVDVTDPSRPALLSGAVVSAGGAGTFQVEFASECTVASRFEAYTAGAMVKPTRVERNIPSDWHNLAGGADYVVIAHRDLVDGLQPLVEAREADGLRVATVIVDDVYDEFSGGIFDPRAIRDFLRYAAGTWTSPPPTYVLLVGEANLDYRRGYHSGPANFVPSMEIDLNIGGQATSDLWFAALDDADFLPDLLLGRISVSTNAQVQTVVGKIRTFETAGAADEWRSRAIMVVDDDDAVQFEAASERLIDLMPDTVVPRRFYAAGYPRQQPLTADIQTAINDGALVMNFIGHGNVDLWSPWQGGSYIFDNNAISALTNADRPAIFTTATCMNGWFSHTLKPTSMSELWLSQPSGGGVAAWSPTGLAPVSGQEALLQPFYSGLYDGRGQPLGALAAEAMLLAYGGSAHWWDTIRMFSLQGDPAMVAVGAPVNPTPQPPVWKAFMPSTRTNR